MVRIVLLLFSETWQRCLLTAAVLLAAIGHALIEPTPSGHSQAFVFLNESRQLAFWILLGLALSGGAVRFRQLSAMRAVSLIRFSRSRLLLGVLLAQILVAACISANTALLAGAAIAGSEWRHIWWIFAISLSAAILWLLCVFAISGATWRAWLLLPLLAAAVSLHSSETAARYIPWTAMAALIVFSSWYLTTTRIATALAVWGMKPNKGLTRRYPPESKRTYTVSECTKLYLLGTASIVSATWRYSVTLVALNIFFVASVISNQQHYKMAPNLGDGPVAFTLLICVAQILVTRAMVTRTRWLWIPGGKSRHEIFRLSERIAWSCLAAISLPFYALSAIELAVVPHSQLDWPRLLFALAAPAASSLYLGLLNVRGRWQLGDLMLGFAIIAGWAGGAYAMRLFPSIGEQMQYLLPTLEILGALLLRRIAWRRWESADWRVLKARPFLAGRQAIAGSNK